MTRRDEILKLIVEYFIKTAKPVSSKTLQEEYGLDYSTATIRNEMSALEKDGLLEKDFSSAGRTPSSLGYQYYIDNLRNGEVDGGAKHALQVLLSNKTKSVEEVLTESCQILSSMTNLASVVLGKKVSEERLASLNIVPLNGHSATAIFVTSQGYVENKTFLIDKTLKVDDVVRGVKLLNERLVGTPISEICSKMEALRPVLHEYMVGQEIIYDAILGAFARFATERMSSYGKEELLSQPEFQNDAQKVREILALLDDPERLKKALEAGDSSDGVSVRIAKKGDGNPDVAIISAEVTLPGNNDAALTLVGPTRMDYNKAVSTLKYFASALDDYFHESEKGKEGDDEEERTSRRSRRTKGE